VGSRFNITKTSQGLNRVNRLALGTVQFGLPYGIANQTGQVTRAEARAMLHLAATNGMDTLDTAIAYGESETCLGEVGTQGFKVITKLPVVPESCSDVSAWVNHALNESLSRLGVAEVYGVLLHRFDQLLSSNSVALYKALQDLKCNGLVQKVGVSIYSPTDLDALAQNYHLDIVQAPFNLVDQRLYRSGWLQRLKDDGVEIHTRSAFLQGLLLMKQAGIPQKFSPWVNLWKIWHGWLADHAISAVQASLAFPLSFPEIDRVVIGADSVSQLSQIMSAANRPLNVHLPNLQCDDLNLINPANWNSL
jgi:aryl-alcohol dehydrogenase-like predicted oxidoreductase